jgi:hypothetical protein
MSLKKLLMAIVFSLCFHYRNMMFCYEMYAHYWLYTKTVKAYGTTISKHIRSNIKSRKFLRRIYIFIEERPTKQDIDIVQYQ